MTPIASPAAPAHLIRIDSPIGRIEITADDDAVTSLTIEKDGRLPLETEPERPTPVLERAAAQLAEYFAGHRHDFDVPVRLEGTAFQKSIWAQLAAIPYGEVASYGALGIVATGRPAGRAVGGAVGANPVPLLVPCHRVLATSGRITGYSAGAGIPTKAWLLDLEGIAHR
ncbi:methylated-DNA--[protein]-cysteine S-methyltransferase [Galbitalea sp. SE-J8]|uniref:methylated-DNA--[protein]-cysteine S-methyltransferase n=1 Tax=Galbitalea sp. SE-J8 TaxID=3054952 RepID=UPI00259D17F1|nr:methylated-DNA--[protein]-cysteine S-methyltransferase [Galbitalea sp. SE-J8]MDM4763462.1 methylated-DNA--[protein]-cysteine S-methyltransferase [Galbitalea sp. SE-J8]